MRIILFSIIGLVICLSAFDNANALSIDTDTAKNNVAGFTDPDDKDPHFEFSGSGSSSDSLQSNYNNTSAVGFDANQNQSGASGAYMQPYYSHSHSKN